MYVPVLQLKEKLNFNGSSIVSDRVTNLADRVFIHFFCVLWYSARPGDGEGGG